MGKTSKKSASKVEAPKAVAAPTKPLKKGKREAQAPIDKEVVSVKKQKLDVKKIEKVAPKKTEKVAKKKVETSSDDDTSSSESEELPKVNVVAKDKMEIDSDDSSSDDSSGLEEVGASKKAPASATKNGHVAVAKKKEESSDESDSDDSSSDDEPVAAAKKAPAAPAKKKDESSDESDSETDDSSSDDEAPAVLATKATAVPVKKDESSSDDSDSDDESSSDEEVAVKKAPAADAKKTSVSAPKKKESSSDESSDSDDDSSSDSDDKAVKVATAKSTVIEAKQVKKEDSEDDSSDEDSSEESDEEPQKKTTTPAPSKKKSSSGSSSEDESSEDEAQPAITPKKKDADVKMADAEKTPKTPFTPKSDTDGSTSIFFGNMAFSIDKPDIHEFFKEVGTVVDVRFAMQDDQFKGYGHVEFSSAEEAKKAIDLNGRDLLGRPVRLDLARARGAQSSDGRPAFQKRGEGPTVFVRGFGQDASEDEVRSSLQEHFGKCGELANVRIPVDYESKSVKGIAYIEFKEAEAYNNALELSGSDMGGYSLYVDEARPRGDAAGGSGGGGRSGGRDFGGRSNGRGFGGRSGGGRGRDFGGRRGGGRDFGGGRGGRGGRGGFNKPSITPSGKKTTFNDDE